MIDIANRQDRRIPIAKVRALAGRILEGEGREGDLSFCFVDNATIHALNRRYLRHDFATDVLAFPMDGTLIGEVVVSVDYAIAEAARRGIPWEEELLRYVAHGTLHLLGYDDHSPRAKKEMWTRQERYLTGPPSERAPGAGPAGDRASSPRRRRRSRPRSPSP